MESQRKVLFIAGAGRSGTSTLAGLVSRLGLHVPQPEVAADESNPKGFGEPQWVVDFHNRLLDRTQVQVSDSRPEAWDLTGAIGEDEAVLEEAATWLAPHFDKAAELVVKDPRLSWFLPVWRKASVRCEATPAFATMLRPPPEVVGSKQRYYAGRLGPAHLAASWVNMLLETELDTRNAPRCFVRYADLLDDWQPVVNRLGDQLDLLTVKFASDQAWSQLDGFIDPTLRRVGLDWADLGLPARLEAITRESWELLNSLVEDDSESARTGLDQLRIAYADLYAESEAISKSSVVAERVRLRREFAARDAAAPSTRPGIADRIPHDLRAKIPAPVRRGLRRVVPRR